jgi:hypothetical protein
VAITILNVLGHSIFGFEQSWTQPLVSLLTAYSVELFIELVSARIERRRPWFAGSLSSLIDFLLPAHISGLAVAMLLYTNQSLGPTVFAASLAVCSKHIFKAPAGRGYRHFFNPSNFGITITLLAFPWVGVAPPYMFTENLIGFGDWLLPAVIICSGTLLNGLFTRRLPLIGAWLGAFIFQAVVRYLFFDAHLAAALAPMTGVTFILYSFYMITDPATTPDYWKAQVYFGISVAALYGMLMIVHVVFGMFFALSIVCAARGIALWVFTRHADSVAAFPNEAQSVTTNYATQ